MCRAPHGTLPVEHSQKDLDQPTQNFMHPSSFTLYPSAFILHPSPTLRWPELLGLKRLESAAGQFVRQDHQLGQLAI